jgi:hypothetical protein
LALVFHATDVGFAAQGATAINCLLRIQHVRYALNHSRFVRELVLDHKYHDIPLEEEEDHRPTRMPRQDIRFSSWTDQECYDFTSFRKHQLQRIYNLFGLAQLAAQHQGFIRVFTGHEFYKFHPEELFLFFMTKCKTGLSHKVLCDLIFGGHASRWSFGFPHILRYLDKRYEDIIGHQHLERYVDQFPAFYEAIQNYVGRTHTYHFTDGTAEDRTGLQFLPFDIFGFIDCSIYRINRPYSGPDGDYIGAPRRERYYDAQRSVYTGYKKCHGIKVETVLLPNGISTIYGPTSARPSDVPGVIRMSGLDAFLLDLQQGRNHIYSAFGDGVYGANGLNCELQSVTISMYVCNDKLKLAMYAILLHAGVCSYFRAFGGANLTQAQRTCNRRMKRCRESVEWSYADVQNIFQICANPNNYKLGKRLPYAQEQLRICHLLSNIYTCLNGSKTCGYQAFKCMPPDLDDYLRL